MARGRGPAEAGLLGEGVAMKIEKVNEIPGHRRRNCRVDALLAVKPGETLRFIPEDGDISAQSLASAFASARKAREELKSIIVTRRGNQVFIHRPEEKT